MNSVILNATNRILSGLLIVFSVFLLLRGHNLPGGGFAGGLVASCAFVLQALTFGVASAKKLLVFDPRTLIAVGLIVALISGLPALFEGLPFMTGLWDKTPLPIVGKLGTPLLFDLGVYIVVGGISCLIVFSLGEELEEEGNQKHEPDTKEDKP
ncbi:MAG: Na+/H+ antiporter subunit B [Terrimicrobiaceae bacterium]